MKFESHSQLTSLERLVISCTRRRRVTNWLETCQPRDWGKTETIGHRDRGKTFGFRDWGEKFQKSNSRLPWGETAVSRTTSLHDNVSFSIVSSPLYTYNTSRSIISVLLYLHIIKPLNWQKPLGHPSSSCVNYLNRRQSTTWTTSIYVNTPYHKVILRIGKPKPGPFPQKPTQIQICKLQWHYSAPYRMASV